MSSLTASFSMTNELNYTNTKLDALAERNTGLFYLPECIEFELEQILYHFTLSVGTLALPSITWLTSVRYMMTRIKGPYTSIYKMI